MLLVLALAVGCRGPAGSTATSAESPAPPVVEQPRASGAAVSASALPPLAISLADHDFSQNPEVLDRILGSPHGYFRFIGRHFTQEVCERFDEKVDSLPLVNLHGDAHLENYTITERQRGLADFDDATPGPFVIDLIRFGVSIQLAARELGVREDGDAIVARFIEGYRSGLLNGDLAIAEPKVVAEVRVGFPRGRAVMLAEAQRMMEPVGDRAHSVLDASQAFFDRMRSEHPRLPTSFFDVKELGTLWLGIGSGLSEKYLMRIEGRTADPDDDLIVEAKSIRDLKEIDCIQRPRLEIARIAISQARLAFEMPRFSGTVTLDPQPDFPYRTVFWLFAWDDNYALMEIPKLIGRTPAFYDVAYDVGVQLGRGHPKSIADPYEPHLRRALLGTLDRVEPEILGAIRDMTQETIEAWMAIRAEAGMEPVVKVPIDEPPS